MNILFNRPSTPEAAAIRERIFNVLPAASYQMEKLFGLLYDADESSKITYHDIYELLRKELAGREVPNVLLLGSHGPEQNEDALLKEAVRRIVEGWPPPPFRIAGRDEGRSAEEFWLRPRTSPVAHSEALSRAPFAGAASMLDEARPFTAGR